MNQSADVSLFSLARKSLKTIWGFDRFRPYQEEGIRSILAGRDSLTVLPTGGGKSVIFQLPMTLLDGMAVVLSPLIALMQDQVQALQVLGVPAACLTSLHSESEIRRTKAQMFRGELKLIYISPERLLMEHVLEELGSLNIRYFAIDEAHCISQWGHDFRPEYTRLNVLKKKFPQIPIHAFTATAPPRIQKEILENLKLRDPDIFVGSYFRSNLHYKVLQRGTIKKQLIEELKRYPESSAGIVYCLTRKETEKISEFLQEEGYKALPYHAGLPNDVRKSNQEKFSREEVHIMVATVAFGMGIDQSNIRFVIHLGMPKSLSHYQQESGRAGRDGLRSSCTLFYGNKDIVFWKRIIAEESNEESMQFHLDCMINYATRIECRHRQLLYHFGQNLDKENCEACDICAGEIVSIPDARDVGKKIISTVFRVRQNFGGAYVAQVLTGSQEQKILANGHQALSVHGLLKDFSQKQVHDWVNQLESQKLLERTTSEFPILKITPKGFQFLNPAKFGKTDRDLPVFLVKTEKPDKKKPIKMDLSYDRDLFEVLRDVRMKLARKAGIPAFMIFGDRSLQDMAARKPQDEDGMLEVFGVGQHKLRKFGRPMLKAICEYVIKNHGLN